MRMGRYAALWGHRPGISGDRSMDLEGENTLRVNRNRLPRRFIPASLVWEGCTPGRAFAEASQRTALLP